MQGICPHNGGTNFDAEKNRYASPVHGAKFDVQDRRPDAPSVSPSDVDSLEFEIREGEVWVKFGKFHDGTSQKVVKI